MSAPSSSPRRTRALATREAILAAAAVEFAASGYHASSLSRVLEGSGVTKGALYFHFASKQDLALAVLARTAEAYREVAARSAGRCPDPLRSAARLAREVQDLFTGSTVARAGQRLAQEGVGGPEWSAFPVTFWPQVFEALFRQARDEGLVHPEVDPVAVGRFVTDFSGGAFRNSLVVSGLADLAERVRHNWEVMFTAIAAPEWLAGWRAEGGMAAVLGEHLPAPAAAAPRDDRAGDLL